MKLTVVIVNYNVEHFLEQCLLSVQRAMQGLACEVFVVDNNSIDGSVPMVRERFAWVQLIANSDNPGFSKANNQAIRLAKGEHVLLLNPDTVVEEDTFHKIVDFMDAHPEAGGLGVKMVDGKGNFLPESKRGLPTPAVAFYKIFGISTLFPKHKKFGRYHLGFLDKDETHEVEILSGAFMLMRKKTLDEVGLLDETFFMYGEDIDLSYRIVKGGYKNYYFADTRIIHYKGESTKKGSLNYVFVFYNAMIIFARKHFSQKNARLFSFFINLAIYFRAALAVASRFVRKAALFALDFGLIIGGLFVVKFYYENAQNKLYSPELVALGFSAYTLVWILGVFFSGGYDKPIKLFKIWRGVLAGAAVILIGYSLLPETYRFSRALILLGTGVAILAFSLSRFLLAKALPGSFGFAAQKAKTYAIVGSESEISRVSGLIFQASDRGDKVLKVSPLKSVTESLDSGYAGTLGQLEDVVRIHKADAVIFCGKDVSSTEIIGAMSDLNTKRVEIKIAPPERLYIIGSNSIDTQGDLFVLDVNSVSRPSNRRAKRTFDVLVSLVLLLFAPLLIWGVKSKKGYLANGFRVLFGKNTWVGYASLRIGANGKTNAAIGLPKLKSSILNPLGQPNGIGQSGVATSSAESAQKHNVLYARDYSARKDLEVLSKGFKWIGSGG